MTDYFDFKYWLVETKPTGMKVWRIEFPGGYRGAPFERKTEGDVRKDIDALIKSAQENP